MGSIFVGMGQFTKIAKTQFTDTVSGCESGIGVGVLLKRGASLAQPGLAWPCPQISAASSLPGGCVRVTTLGNAEMHCYTLGRKF